jgi:hypothetical protein
MKLIVTLFLPYVLRLWLWARLAMTARISLIAWEDVFNIWKDDNFYLCTPNEHAL